jgi:hypothetical protein
MPDYSAADYCGWYYTNGVKTYCATCPRAPVDSITALAAVRKELERLATMGHETWKTVGHPMNEWVRRDTVNRAANAALADLDALSAAGWRVVRGDGLNNGDTLETVDRAAWREDGPASRMVQGITDDWTPREGDTPVWRRVSPK